MMKKILIILYLLFSFNAFTASPRTVEMSWRPSQGALSYEVQIFKIISGSEKKLSQEKINSTVFNKSLLPGDYAFQVRALDYRNVPGQWGQKKFFKVSLPTVKQISPAINQAFDLSEDEDINITLLWDEIPEAEKYDVQLKTEEGDVIFSELINDTAVSVDFSKPGKYFWKVTALTSKDKRPNKVAFQRFFHVHPPKMPPPEVEFEVKNEFFSIKWDGRKNTIKDKITIYKKGPQGWDKIYKREQRNIHRVKMLKDKIEEGRYKLRLVTYGKDNRASEPSIVFFNWDQKNVSNIESKSSPKISTQANTIDRHGKSPYILKFGLSSTEQSYQGRTHATDTNFSDNLIGTVIHIDASKKVFNKKYIWQNSLSLSSLIDAKFSWLLPRFTTELAKKFKFASFHHIKLGLGGAYTALPYIKADSSTEESTQGDISTLSLLGSMQYGYDITDYWQIGFSSKLQLHSVATSNPTNQSLSPSIGMLNDFFLKYIVTKNTSFKGFLGGNEDSLSFKNEGHSFSGSHFGIMLNIDL